MTNYELYKNPQVRVVAFLDYCRKHDKVANITNAMNWLDEPLETLPCPFCGSPCDVRNGTRYTHKHQVICLNEMCGYQSHLCVSVVEAVLEHNRVAMANKETWSGREGAQ